MTTTTETKEITNSEDVIDVRDVIARVEHLEQLRQPGAVDLDDDNETDQDTLFAELSALESLLDELRGNGGDHEWRDAWYPVTLIRESYFKEYAQELADDIGAIDRNAGWPSAYIDWDAASDALLIDYSAVIFDGVEYYYR
jgi:hypothetical protein